jgi:hypothetical protein
MKRAVLRREVRIFILLLLFIIAFDVLFWALPTGDSATGRVVTIVNISNSTFISCTVNLSAGTNVFSGFCLGNENPIQDILGNMTSLQHVFSYVPSDANDPWKSYKPNLPSWAIQDLAYLSRDKGYVIVVGSVENFTYNGILKLENSIAVTPSWNLIGYPTNQVRLTSFTFTSLAGSYNEVAGFNETLQQYQTYQPTASNNSLNWTTPYHGYWVNASASGNVIINN